MNNKFGTTCYNHKSRSKKGFALLLVVIGVLLLGFNLGLIPAEYKPIFLSWQMLLIVIGFFSLFGRKIVGGILLMAVGTFFLLPVIGISFPALLGGTLVNARLYWPVLLIVAGILVLFKKKNNRWAEHWAHHKAVHQFESESDPHSEADYVTKNVMFNGSEQIVFSSNFKGGNLNVAFGEIKLDLRKVTGLTDNNKLEANAMFGSIIIYLPSDWQLNLKSSVMFGDIKDKRILDNKISEEKVITLNMEGSCLFGGIEIRS